MTKVIRVVGYIFLYGAIAFILFNWGAIIYFQGFWKLAEIVSPFNIINWLLTAATVAPGVLLLWWADKRDQKI